MRHHFNFKVELGFGDGDFFRVRNPFKQNVRQNVLACRLAVVFAKLVFIRARKRHVLFKRHTLRLQLRGEFVNHPVNAIFDHHGRQVNRHVRDGFIDNCLALSLNGATFGLSLHVLANVGAVFGKRLEFADFLGEGVVKFGQFAVLDAVNFALENGIFAGNVLGVVIVGERDFNGARFADLRADKLFLEVADKFVCANFKRLIFSLAARKFFAVDSADIIQRDKVAVDNRIVLRRLD